MISLMALCQAIIIKTKSRSKIDNNKIRTRIIQENGITLIEKHAFIQTAGSSSNSEDGSSIGSSSSSSSILLLILFIILQLYLYMLRARIKTGG